MPYRLPAERVPLEVDGPSVEVERIIAWPTYWMGLRLLSTFLDAKKPDAELLALRDLYALFVAEGRPSWDILDHAAPLAATLDGCLRLPVALGTEIVSGWIETFNQQPPATAADAVLPPGPVRDEIKARLKAKKPDPEV